MKISVIIPCYNVENYISDCLDAILSQTIGIDCLEIIIVDDCSTDKTVEIISDYERRFSEQIMLILCEKNGKQGTARNIGLQYATGDYISFVDADDWINHDMYKMLVGIAESEECDLVQFRYQVRLDKSHEDENITDIQYSVYNILDVETRRNILLDSNIINESCTQKLYKRELLESANVFYAENVSYEEPLFTYPLKFHIKRIAVTETPLYYYRFNSNGTTASYMSKTSTILEHLQVQQMVLNRMVKSEFYQEYKEEIEFYYINTFFIEPFYFLKKRGTVLPLVLFEYMKKEILLYVPYLLTNKYVEFLDEQDRAILSLINESKNVHDTAELEKMIQDRQNKLLV